MKNAFVVTITNGYMFSLNASINAMKHFGTNADFHILYQWETPSAYIEAYKKAFPNTFWVPLSNWGSSRKYTDTYHIYFADKYDYALKIKDEYDSICIIDGDLFLCDNMNEYFRLAGEEGKFITATHEHCGMPIGSFYQQSLELVVDRCRCAFADFPVFVNTKLHEKFLFDWLEQTFHVQAGTEINHPLIAMNRSILKNIPKETFIVLDGNRWVCDKNYWITDIVRQGDRLVNQLGNISAIHNRWWKEGRANGDFNASIGIEESKKNHVASLDRVQNNMNNIVDYMEWFNDMTPETRVVHYCPTPLDWRKHLGKDANFGK